MFSEFAVRFENQKCTIYHVLTDKSSVQKTHVMDLSEKRGLNIIRDKTFFRITSVIVYNSDSYTVYGVLV